MRHWLRAILAAFRAPETGTADVSAVAPGHPYLTGDQEMTVTPNERLLLERLRQHRLQPGADLWAENLYQKGFLSRMTYRALMHDRIYTLAEMRSMPPSLFTQSPSYTDAMCGEIRRVIAASEEELAVGNYDGESLCAGYLLYDGKDVTPPPGDKPSASQIGDPFGDSRTLDEVYENRLISTRTYNVLRQVGYRTVRTVRDLRGLSEADILRAPNMGRKSLREVKELLEPGSPAGVATLSIGDLRDRGLISDQTFNSLEEYNRTVAEDPDVALSKRRALETAGQLAEANPLELINIPGIAKDEIDELFAIASHCWADGPDIMVDRDVLGGDVRYIRLDSILERLWASCGHVRVDQVDNLSPRSSQ